MSKTPPNDMRADTELREQVHAIILKTDDYMKFCAIQDMPWNRSGNLLDELMQLIKARDAAIRIDELEKWLPVADTWAKQEGIYGPQIQFKRRIAELSTPTDQKEKTA